MSISIINFNYINLWLSQLNCDLLNMLRFK